MMLLSFLLMRSILGDFFLFLFRLAPMCRRCRFLFCHLPLRKPQYFLRHSNKRKNLSSTFATWSASVALIGFSLARKRSFGWREIDAGSGDLSNVHSERVQHWANLHSVKDLRSRDAPHTITGRWKERMKNKFPWNSFSINSIFFFTFVLATVIVLKFLLFLSLFIVWRTTFVGELCAAHCKKEKAFE